MVRFRSSFPRKLWLGILFAAWLLPGRATAQTFNSQSPGLNCSPAPCVLPPIQASERGAEVADAPIAADPLNPQHLLVGSSDFNCPGSSSGFHFSPDGGSNWNHTCMPVVRGNGRIYIPGGEPMVGFDRNGVAYIADVYGDTEGLGYGLIAFQSSSSGKSWTPPKLAWADAHHFPIESWMVVDTSPTSPFINTLYLSLVVLNEPAQTQNQLVVAHSNDGGKHWIDVDVVPVQISPSGESYTNMVVGRDGTVYLSFMYCNVGPGFCQDNRGHMMFTKSTDGGNTWSKPVLTATVHLGGLPNAMVGVDDYPAIGVDNSDGPYSGSLYVSMYDWTGSQMRVQVVRSTDGGSTWSKPVPVAPLSETHDQFFPWLSLGPTGLVGVSWLDRRNDPANIDYQAFAAISRDGGQSFRPDIQLTTAFSNPNVNGYPQNLWMGNYTGNTWAGSDFIAAWMDSSNGVDMQDVVGGIRVK